MPLSCLLMTEETLLTVLIVWHWPAVQCFKQVFLSILQNFKYKYNQRSHINGITDCFAAIISQACVVRQWVYCIHQERHLNPPSTGWKRALSACSYLLLASVPSIHENAECENAEMQPPHMLWHSSQPTPPLHLPSFLHAKICFRKSLMKVSFTSGPQTQ